MACGCLLRRLAGSGSKILVGAAASGHLERAGNCWRAVERYAAAQGWFVIEVGGLLVGVYTSCSIRPRDIRSSFGHYRLPRAAFSCPLDPINSPHNKFTRSRT